MREGTYILIMSLSRIIQKIGRVTRHVITLLRISLKHLGRWLDIGLLLILAMVLTSVAFTTDLLHNKVMADPIVWGELPKAQDDPQTIAEAIAAAIAAHEADPDAHLGDGESLESHRANEIIDHPAGSVLADKWTLSQAEYTTLFESLGGFGITGEVDQLFPGVQIISNGSGSGHLSALDIDLESASEVFFPGGDFLFQFIFNADTFSGGHLLFNFGYGVVHNNKAGVGLVIDDSVASFYSAQENGTVIDTLSWPSFTDVDLTYVVRLQHNSGDNFVTVYINGEVLGTLDWTLTDSDSDVAGIQFATTKGSTSQCIANLKSLYWSIPLSSS